MQHQEPPREQHRHYGPGLQVPSHYRYHNPRYIKTPTPRKIPFEIREFRMPALQPALFTDPAPRSEQKRPLLQRPKERREQGPSRHLRPILSRFEGRRGTSGALKASRCP